MLEERLNELQQKVIDHGVSVDKSLKDDIVQIMNGQNLEVTPHMKFFWQEQMKFLQSSSSGRRYHPQVTRFALSVHGHLLLIERVKREWCSYPAILPSERVLRDYKNYFTQKLE